jgi:Fic family protein
MSNAMYIWQQNDWQQGSSPAFHWQEEHLRPLLEQVKQLQMHLLATHHSHESAHPETTLNTTQLNTARLDALVQNALRTSEIEGEILNAGSVRSSVVNKLGLENAGLPVGRKDGTAQTDALAKLLIDATTQVEQPISVASLCQWQAALFVVPDSLNLVKVGQLRSDTPMQVVSGRVDSPSVHFEAPPRDTLDAEMQRFVKWFNCSPATLDPHLRAAITHLWLVTLHPFDDGNGRVTRALTDRALAQADGTSIRYYSHSAAIMARRSEYYDILQHSQSGSLDITPWLSWFLNVLLDAMQQGQHRFKRVLCKTRFWQLHAQTVLNERQVKVLNRLLDTWGEEFTSGINASKYQSLAKVSKATATRELADLLNKDCLHKLPGGGRSTRYALCRGSHPELDLDGTA